jgi:hypothetical protein
MPETTSILSQQWTDILPPLAPEPMAWWLLLSSVVLAVLVVVVVSVLWQQRPRQRALRVLRRCTKQLASKSIDSRHIAAVLHNAMLSGLGLHPASMVKGARPSDPQWQQFYRQLQHCVFQATPPSPDELAPLIQQGRYWLRNYPQ